MKRLLVRVYVAGTILFFAGLIAFFFWSLNELRNTNEHQASLDFVTLAARIEQSWQDPGLPGAGEAISERLRQPLPGQPLVVSVYSFDIGIDYLWARDDRFITGTPGGSVPAPPEISMNEIVHRRFSRTFLLADGERRIVTAVYPILTEESVFPLLKRILLVLLVFTSLVLAAALVHALAQLRTSKPPKAVVAPPQPLPEATDGPAEAAAAALYPSGLNPETALTRRVTMELEHSAFQEQDFSLALISFSEGTRGDEQYQRNARAILTFFTYEDLCFEYGENTVAVLFPRTTLGDALGQMERFQRFYWEERHNWKTPELELYCGVSARNGRLVDGERVLIESAAALRRSKDTPGRIMGFQPDPQRYRSYLQDQSR